MTTAYSWDEVICEVSEWELDLPDGLSDDDLITLADARITEACQDPFGTFDRKTRTLDGTLVLDALFGQNKVCRTYLNRNDPAKAKEHAQGELEAYLED